MCFSFRVVSITHTQRGGADAADCELSFSPCLLPELQLLLPRSLLLRRHSSLQERLRASRGQTPGFLEIRQCLQRHPWLKKKTTTKNCHISIAAGCLFERPGARKAQTESAAVICMTQLLKIKMCGMHASLLPLFVTIKGPVLCKIDFLYFLTVSVACQWTALLW